jgi:hypothetical protein
MAIFRTLASTQAVTCFLKQKKTIILKATDILAAQMLKFIGSFY